MSDNYNWKDHTDWKYPYKGINDPKYIKDKDDFLSKNGNGWWWGNGWWNGHTDTVADRQRKSRERRNNAI